MSSNIVEVVRINNLVKHPNADTLYVATIKGWPCIVKEGQFSVGNLAVYIPIDSVIPDELADKYNLEYLKKGNRVRTIKLRGVISQGLLLTLPEGVNWKEGRDVAKEMGVTKWEPPAPSYQRPGQGNRTIKNPNPNFRKYTNIEHIKNYPDMFENGEEIIITEKIHGTNWRAANIQADPKTWWEKIKANFRGNYEFIVGSHNVQLGRGLKGFLKARKSYYGSDIYSTMAKKLDIESILPKGYALYGELYGEGIQDLTYGQRGHNIAFFDLMIDGEYADYSVFEKFCKDHDLPMVPVLYRGPYFSGVIEKYTDGKSVIYPSQIREGIVIKPAKNTIHPRVGRKILKSVSNKYLLRKNGTEYN